MRSRKNKNKYGELCSCIKCGGESSIYFDRAYNKFRVFCVECTKFLMGSDVDTVVSMWNCGRNPSNDNSVGMRSKYLEEMMEELLKDVKSIEKELNRLKKSNVVERSLSEGKILK